MTDSQTDRAKTDHATPSETIGQINIVLRCSLKTTAVIPLLNARLSWEGTLTAPGEYD